MTHQFTPDKLESTATLQPSDLFMRLDLKFMKLVKTGWHDKTKIDLVLEINTDAGRSLSVLRDETIEYYKSLGWSEVLIKTSEESGERPGLVMIALSKVSAENQECSLPTT